MVSPELRSAKYDQAEFSDDVGSTAYSHHRCWNSSIQLEISEAIVAAYIIFVVASSARKMRLIRWFSSFSNKI